MDGAEACCGQEYLDFAVWFKIMRIKRVGGKREEKVGKMI